MSVIRFTKKYTTPDNASGVGGSYINLGQSSDFDVASRLRETHTFWGQPFNGTQDVFGDLTGVGGIQMSGNLISGGNGIFDGRVTTAHLKVDYDASIDGDLKVKGDVSIDGSTRLTDLESHNIYNTNDIRTKNLTVTGRATFFELLIEQISATNGSLMVTPARGFKIDCVQQIDTNIYLFFRQNQDGIAIKQTWKVGDQLLHYDFNKAEVGLATNVSNKYYWALVNAVSSSPTAQLPYYPYTKISEITTHSENEDGEDVYYHWVRLSTNSTTYDGVLEPEIGDDCVQCGYRGADDPQRQSAIYIATVDSLDSGIHAPFIAQYRGINEFSLSKFRKSYFDANGAKFFGDFEITGEVQQTIQDKIDDYMKDHPVATPYIGDNGNWWIDGTDTGIKATGDNGHSPVITIGDDGCWWIDGVSTGVKATGDNGSTPYIQDGIWYIDGTTTNVKAEGIDGSSGKDAIQFVMTPPEVVFETDSTGKVVGNKYVTIYAVRGNTTIDYSLAYGSGHVNCEYFNGSSPVPNFSKGYTAYFRIPDSAYQEIDTVNGKSYIAPTSGVLYLVATVDSVNYNLSIPFSVNIQKYVNDFHVGLKEFTSEYQTYKTTTNGILEEHSSLIAQNAEAISLKVDTKNAFPNLVKNPIYRESEYYSIMNGASTSTENRKTSVTRVETDTYSSLEGGGRTPVDIKISSPWSEDGGRMYRISIDTALSANTPLYCIDRATTPSTSFVDSRVKLKGGETYTASIWIAMPDDYNTTSGVMTNMLYNTNLVEINLWKDATGMSTQDRAKRYSITLDSSNKVAQKGIWEQYSVTFTTPFNETISSGGNTTTYGNYCWLSMQPLIYAKSGYTGRFWVSGFKLESGNRATSMSYDKYVDGEKLLATGIDIENRKITFTSDNIIAQNNRGETTFRLNENGDVYVGGSGVFNGFVFSPPTIITAENYNDYCFYDSTGVKVMDIEKTSPYVIFKSLPSAIPGASSSNGRAMVAPPPTVETKVFFDATISHNTAQICDEMLCYAQDWDVPTFKPLDVSVWKYVDVSVYNPTTGQTETQTTVRAIDDEEADFWETYVSPIYLPSINKDGTVYHFHYDWTTQEKVKDIRRYINTPIVIINCTDEGIGLSGNLTLISPRGDRTEGVSTVIPSKSARYCKPVYTFAKRNSKCYECLYWEISQVYPQSDGLIEMYLD